MKNKKEKEEQKKKKKKKKKDKMSGQQSLALCLHTARHKRGEATSRSSRLMASLPPALLRLVLCR